MRFKTNAKCGGCEAAIRMKLNGVVKDGKWSLDLDSDDKVLTVTDEDVPAADVMEAVRDAGFRIERLD